MTSDNEDGDANQELLEQVKQIDGFIDAPKRDSLKVRFSKAWKLLQIKAALGHVGLLVSLSIYCAVGGLVSKKK